jgi:hypothetical protein
MRGAPVFAVFTAAAAVLARRTATRRAGAEVVAACGEWQAAWSAGRYARIYNSRDFEAVDAVEVVDRDAYERGEVPDHARLRGALERWVEQLSQTGALGAPGVDDEDER